MRLSPAPDDEHDARVVSRRTRTTSRGDCTDHNSRSIGVIEVWRLRFPYETINGLTHREATRVLIAYGAPHRRGAIFHNSPFPVSVTTYRNPSGPCRTSRTLWL